ncbi:hypothetical protein [Pedobacter endophyticus]|uniref:Uncharacterized protein n=1 Tax=Pedobacter endophyticus TaxID=2789740 RepID=A0A7S9L3B7_9SPHI|nr:hypothetical protein [Pedobacter endophyticus]QPH41683.1 hypothetical protein IZT61_10705 [Pedobacter endophyticus]
MKPRNLIGLLMVVCLAACKKGGTKPEPVNPLELLSDSASFLINGRTYNALAIEKRGTLTTQSNLKITSGINYNYELVGDKDSILFVREYDIRASYTKIAVSFIKIYHNDETVYGEENNGGYLYYPKNKTEIFAPGLYKYSTDFFRKNSTSGIAFTLINQQGVFKSYGQSDLGKPASVTQEDQRESKFEIISLRKRKADYLLEARFNLTVFDENKKPLKIDNGYMRMGVLPNQ